MPKIKVLCGLGRGRRKSFGPMKNQKNETRALGLHNELDQPNQKPRLATARTNWTMTSSYWQQPWMPPYADDGMNGRKENLEHSLKRIQVTRPKLAGPGGKNTLLEADH